MPHQILESPDLKEPTFLFNQKRVQILPLHPAVPVAFQPNNSRIITKN